MQITCKIHVNNDRLLMNQQFKLLKIAVTSKWKEIKVVVDQPDHALLSEGSS